jgi:hypothetical protein
MVNPRVDQVTGPPIWTYGSWRTRRGGGEAGPAAGGLHEPHRAGADLRRGSQVGQGDRGEGDAGRPIAYFGDVDAAAAALAGIHDAAVLDLDPGLQPVDEPEPVVGGQFVQVAEHLGWWRVVVGDAEPEREAVETLHRPWGIHDSEVTEDSMRMADLPVLPSDQAEPRWAHRC